VSDVGGWLAELRRAGEARDWNGARAAVAELLAVLPGDDALSIAHEQVSRRLPSFEAHHPGDEGPRRLLAILAGQAAPADEDPEAQDCVGPGGNNFIAALAALLRARQATDRRARVRACTDAIAEAIMAESTAHWGARFPEAWRRWYEADPASGTVDDAWVARMADPALVGLERAGWMHLADELARRVRT
jgi:hypothetical protein